MWESMCYSGKPKSFSFYSSEARKSMKFAVDNLQLYWLSFSCSGILPSVNAYSRCDFASNSFSGLKLQQLDALRGFEKCLQMSRWKAVRCFQWSAVALASKLPWTWTVTEFSWKEDCTDWKRMIGRYTQDPEKMHGETEPPYKNYFPWHIYCRLENIW